MSAKPDFNILIETYRGQPVISLFEVSIITGMTYKTIKEAAEFLQYLFQGEDHFHIFKCKLDGINVNNLKYKVIIDYYYADFTGALMIIKLCKNKYAKYIEDRYLKTFQEAVSHIKTLKEVDRTNFKLLGRGEGHRFFRTQDYIETKEKATREKIIWSTKGHSGWSYTEKSFTEMTKE